MGPELGLVLGLEMEMKIKLEPEDQREEGIWGREIQAASPATKCINCILKRTPKMANWKGAAVLDNCLA